MRYRGRKCLVRQTDCLQGCPCTLSPDILQADAVKGLIPFVTRTRSWRDALGKGNRSHPSFKFSPGIVSVELNRKLAVELSACVCFPANWARPGSGTPGVVNGRVHGRRGVNKYGQAVVLNSGNANSVVFIAISGSGTADTGENINRLCFRYVGMWRHLVMGSAGLWPQPPSDTRFVAITIGCCLQQPSNRVTK